jgi:hypothetical protein
MEQESEACLSIDHPAKIIILLVAELVGRIHIMEARQRIYKSGQVLGLTLMPAHIRRNLLPNKYANRGKTTIVRLFKLKSATLTKDMMIHPFKSPHNPRTAATHKTNTIIPYMALLGGIL